MMRDDVGAGSGGGRGRGSGCELEKGDNKNAGVGASMARFARLPILLPQGGARWKC